MLFLKLILSHRTLNRNYDLQQIALTGPDFGSFPDPSPQQTNANLEENSITNMPKKNIMTKLFCYATNTKMALTKASIGKENK